MAEIRVAAALRALTSPLASEGVPGRFSCSSFRHHSSLVNGLHDDIDSIRSHLESIRFIVGVADRKVEMDGDDGPLVRQWLMRIRNVSCEIEDVLDNLTYEVNSDRGEGGEVLLGIVTRYRYKRRVLATYRRTAAEFGRLKLRVREILSVYNSNVCHRLLPLLQYSAFPSIRDGASWAEQHSASSSRNIINEDGIFFSLDKRGCTPKEVVEGWIIQEERKLSPQQMVIAIWGKGGLGKTTLVGEIYHNPKLNRKFDCCAWVNVYRTYSTKKLLLNMLEKLEVDLSKVDMDDMNEQQIILWIGHILHGKRYLVVFDGVWQHDFWSEIGHMFRKNHDLRSRILITTRDEKIAMSLTEKDRVLSLSPLQEEEAWSLFCKKTFHQDAESKCPPDLEHWARRIVDDCGGLPMAIVAVAGMMSTRQRDVTTWERSYKSLSLKFGDNPEMSMLMHCYYDLPSYLKQCFLYCGIYPESTLFSTSEVTMLWVVEGFIEETIGMALEQVARGYLGELVERSFIQVAERDDSGEVTHWKVNDMLRMIALKRSNWQKFPIDLDEECNLEDGRHFLACKTSQEFPTELHLPSLRTLVLLPTDGERAAQISLLNFKLLRFLCLEGVPIVDLPEEIFDLFNLQYLNLRKSGFKVDVFPRKIQRLQNLQALSLWNTRVEQLPRNVVNLSKLRHLLFRNELTRCGFQAPFGIWGLNNLQRLGLVEANDELVENVGQLRQLTVFLITKVKQTHEETLCGSLKRMRHLRDLQIDICEGELSNLEHMNPPPPQIQDIRLFGQLASIPVWFQSFSCLRLLYLTDSKLRECDPLDHLRSLPSLAKLWLRNAYEGLKLTFPANCFHSLKVLYIDNMAKLKSIEINEAALPVLSKLCIWACGSLTLPMPQIKNLEKLKELVLKDLSADVVEDFHEKCSCCSNVKLILK